MTRLATLLVILLVSAHTSDAQELKTVLQKVENAAAAGEFGRALKEAEALKLQLEELHRGRLRAFLPETLGEFRAERPAAGTLGAFISGAADVSYDYIRQTPRAKISVVIRSAIGIHKNVVSICNPNIGQVLPGAESISVGSHLATFQSKDIYNQSSVSVCLAGGIVSFASSDRSLAEELKKLATMFNYEKLEVYLKALA